MIVLYFSYLFKAVSVKTQGFNSVATGNSWANHDVLYIQVGSSGFPIFVGNPRVQILLLVPPPCAWNLLWVEPAGKLTNLEYKQVSLNPRPLPTKKKQIFYFDFVNITHGTEEICSCWSELRNIFTLFNSGVCNWRIQLLWDSIDSDTWKYCAHVPLEIAPASSGYW